MEPGLPGPTAIPVRLKPMTFSQYSDLCILVTVWHCIHSTQQKRYCCWHVPDTQLWFTIQEIDNNERNLLEIHLGSCTRKINNIVLLITLKSDYSYMHSF